MPEGGAIHRTRIDGPLPPDGCGTISAASIASTKLLVPQFELLELSPLPAFEHLSSEQYVAFVRELVADVEHQTRVRHAADGTRPLGVSAILAADPFATPAPAPRTPAPLFLTATRDAWKELRAAYRDVLAAFREASGRLRRGAEEVAFPEGTFPPAGPMRGPPAGELLFPAAYIQ